VAVYIREAHPSDIWQMTSNVLDEVVYQSAQTVDERADLAGMCIGNLGIETPAVLLDVTGDPVGQ